MLSGKRFQIIKRTSGLWLALGALFFPGTTFPGKSATFMVTNTSTAGTGSLYWAITNANDTFGSDTIAFNLAGSGPFSIAPTNPLPDITESVVIDATTQPGYTGTPKIELNGTSAGVSASGLHVLAPECTVRGLAINRFAQYGIAIDSYPSNTVQACFLGTGVYGTNSLGNTFGGISINSAGNLIGGTEATNRNLISGGNGIGVYIVNNNARNNRIQGNLIGTDITATKRLGNGTGIFVSSASSNTIGGELSGARNIVSGNNAGGIVLTNASGCVIAGNHVGLDVTGSSVVSNVQDGITIISSANVTIGGTNSLARNIISGNGGRGVLLYGNNAVTTNNLVVGNYIGTTADGLSRLANGTNGVELLSVSGNIIGSVNSSPGNLISGNAFNGISISGSNATANIIQGNFIGTDRSSSNAIPNSTHGIILFSTGGNLIQSNTVSGNSQNGIYLTGSNAAASSILGNLIGTDFTGRRRVGNGLSGVRIETAGNIVGGTNPAARNIISGNTNNGVYLYNVVASNNLVLGNFIGTSVDGNAALPNAIAGIGIDGASGNNIGGATLNLISGNDQHGVYIRSNSASANLIQSNFIGTDSSGSSAIPNGNYWVANNNLSTVGGGVDISSAPTNNLTGNLISGNWRDAICLGDPGASNNVIQGNLVGVKADAITALGNEWNGVEIRDAGGGSGTVIGGTAGAGNIFAYATLSQRSGVRIRTPVGASPNTNILVRGNSIYANGGSGITGYAIDLGTFGVNANDSCDTDTGANQQQNSPALLSAFSDGAHTRITGTLNSVATSTYLLQFYASPTPVTGNLQGRIYLGEAAFTTGANCTSNFPFVVTLPTGTTVGSRIAASATDAANNTSEFSTEIVVAQAPPNLFPFGNPASGSSPLTLLWPTNAPGLTLQQTTDLTPPVVWIPATNIPALTGTNFSVSVPPTNGNRFFRLQLQ